MENTYCIEFKAREFVVLKANSKQDVVNKLAEQGIHDEILEISQVN